jgi:hypothetical protein
MQNRSAVLEARITRSFGSTIAAGTGPPMEGEAAEWL